MPEPLRVGVVVAQLCARVPGGTGRYTRELVTALRDSAGPRVRREVYAVAPRGCPPARELGVPVARLALPSLALSRLWERGLTHGPVASGVLHAPTLLVPPTRRGVGLVVTCHDVVPWTHPETLTPRGVAFHRRMGERMARDADVVVTPTEAVARQVRAHLRPRGEVRAVLLGSASLPLPRDAAARRAALGATRRYVLFVGTAEPRKGLDLLVAALRHPAVRDLDLVVVGPPGWGDVRVGHLAQQAGVTDRVRVTGRVDDADLAALYAGAAVVAMPSRAEGFGLPVLEAMTAGVPVVTSDDPALLEVGADATWVSPVGDVDGLAVALAGAAAQGPERDDRIARGTRRAAELSWPVAAATMWEIYAGVAARR